ncbi:MAG: hypothetical protein E7329_08195 [Clostridiales bacterium]|nr:hypothetical protein [Clostridiales bacterium]
MILEELSVSFLADISPFAAAMEQLSGIISAAGSQADGLASQFYEAGVQAGEGLENGLLSRKSAVAAAASALAQAAAAALQGALQIHSPSRLTYETGRFFDEGLLQGIAGSAGRVEKEAASLGMRAAAALEIPEIKQPVAPAVSVQPTVSPADQLLSQLSLTIPLEIDGYRLGVAAIEGINRVNAGTGRIELSI